MDRRSEQSSDYDTQLQMNMSAMDRRSEQSSDYLFFLKKVQTNLPK